jgi:hypothetical protein
LLPLGDGLARLIGSGDALTRRRAAARSSRQRRSARATATCGKTENRPECRAKASAHTVKALREGEAVGDDVLRRLASAAEELRWETVRAKSEQEDWVTMATELAKRLGGRNRLAAALGVSGPYLGRVLRGMKPMTTEIREKLNSLIGLRE